MSNNNKLDNRITVAIYFLLTITITWGAIWAAVGMDGILGDKEITAAQMPVLYVATLLGPALAGLLMTAIVDGKQGFRTLFKRLAKWRADLRWYAFALLTAPVLIMSSLLVLSLFSPVFKPAIFLAENKVSLILIGVGMGVAVGLFEELGWTGFAIPRLRQDFGDLETGLITGFVWGLWHLPLFAASAKLSGSVPPLLYVCLLLFTFLPVYRVLMVWLYGRTESILLTLLMHAPLSGSQLVLIPADLSGLQLVTYNLLFTALLWLLVLAIRAKERKTA